MSARTRRKQADSADNATVDLVYLPDDALGYRRLRTRTGFRYVDAAGRRSPDGNPNGSIDDIAGILDTCRNVLGMMPHPEDLIEDLQGGTDGRGLFESVLNTMVAAA